MINKEHSPNQKRKILIIEFLGDPTGRLGRYVTFLGHECIGAYDLETALQEVKSEQPDLILLNVSFWSGDRYGIVSDLRKVYQGSIVALSEKEAEHAIRAGCDFHFYYPEETTKLLELLKDPRLWMKTNKDSN